MAKLGDFFTIASGGTPDKRNPSYYENGTIPWVKTGDLKNQYVPAGIECITEEGLNNSSAKLFPPNTVLVAMYGATIGACSILTYEAATNQACAAFLPNENVLPTYLYYFLSSKREQFVKDGVGGAQPNISAGYLKNVQFGLIPMQQQIDIVEKLDKVEKLIVLRKEQLAKLDQLVKARFVEMFSDFVHSKNTVFLEEISDFVTVGIANSATHAYANSGIVMLRNQNIKENYLDENDLIYITPDFAKKYGSKQLAENDILVIRTGYPGVACLVPKKFEGCQTFTTLIVRLKDATQAHANYVCHYINSSFGKDYVEQTKVGVAQQNFGAKVLAKMPIVIPSMGLQEQFTTLVEQTNKTKLTIQTSLDKLEVMKKALMQQYFG